MLVPFYSITLKETIFLNKQLFSDVLSEEPENPREWIPENVFKHSKLWPITYTIQYSAKQLLLLLLAWSSNEIHGNNFTSILIKLHLDLGFRYITLSVYLILNMVWECRLKNLHDRGTHREDSRFAEKSEYRGWKGKNILKCPKL